MNTMNKSIIEEVNFLTKRKSHIIYAYKEAVAGLLWAINCAIEGTQEYERAQKHQWTIEDVTEYCDELYNRYEKKDLVAIIEERAKFLKI